MNESPEHQSPELEDELFVRTLLGQSQIEETPELLEGLRRLRAARTLPAPEPSGDLAVLLQGNVTGNVTPLAKRSRRRGIILSFALASAMAAGTTGVAASNDGRITCDSFIDAGPFQQADPGEAPDDTLGEADEPAADESDSEKSDNSEPDDSVTQADEAGTQSAEPAEGLLPGSDVPGGPGGWSSPSSPAPEPEPEPGAAATGPDAGAAGSAGEPGPAAPPSTPEADPETAPSPAPDPAAGTQNPEAPGHGGQGRGAGRQGPPHSGADEKPNGNGRGVPEGEPGSRGENRSDRDLRRGGPVDGDR